MINYYLNRFRVVNRISDNKEPWRGHQGLYKALSAAEGTGNMLAYTGDPRLWAPPADVVVEKALS